jgi:hypothetical protein
VAESPGRDFFISYTQVDRPWAEWIAVQLEAAGYSTVLQAWDFRPGRGFLRQMQQATSTARRTIAVLSPAYFGSKWGEAEWRAAFVKDPTLPPTTVGLSLGRTRPFRTFVRSVPPSIEARRDMAREAESGSPRRPSN